MADRCTDEYRREADRIAADPDTKGYSSVGELFADLDA